ncbi:MAG: hypothetical protein HY237_06685 [Acidobacteria bacterium]|nr:hypothetical protein [Acidobacteriota bacterium]
MILRSKLVLWCLVALALVAAAVVADGQSCLTIQSGLLTDVNGNPLTTGYDGWGYNYQAHTFNGLWGNYTRPTPPLTEDNCASVPYGCDNLEMKWNDAWLSNKSCDNDSKLDRHFGYTTYIGSGAWLTNHQSGSYNINVDGKDKLVHWTYFVKIVAVPSDAVPCSSDATKWCSPGGTEIGPSIWGPFAIIQEVYNDPFAGAHGVLYKSPAGPGFGIYGNHP